ncbi:MAG: aminoglycoside phosphotransferase family protein [bacterium]
MGAPIVVPAGLRAAADTAYGPDLQRWVAGLPEAVAAVRAHWSLTLGPVLQPGGRGSWVAPVVDGGPAGAVADLQDGLVVKIAFRHPEAEAEATGLRLLTGRSAVRLVDEWQDERTAALLLERCRPGVELGRARAGPEQDAVVAAMLRHCWSVPVGDARLPSLESMAAYWADSFREQLDRTRAVTERERASATVDPGLAAEALSEWSDLARPGPGDRMLLTDLHAGNILSARREPWLLIDPKPHLGDPAYDPLQHLLNCPDRLTTNPAALADGLAERCGLDAARLRRWLFARCVLESLDRPELADVARLLTGR